MSGETLKRQTLAIDLALAAGMLGFAPLAKKMSLTAGTGPLPLAAASTGVAALAALSYLGFSARSALSVPHRRAFLHVALVGILGSGVVVLLAVVAMTGTTATNRSVFQSMYPVATAVCARLILGERLSIAAYVTILIMVSGLMLMNSGEGGLRFGRPFLLLAATLPLIGLSDVYAKRTLDDADPRFVAAGRLVVGSLFVALLVAVRDVEDWSGVAASWPWVILAGLAMAGGVLGLYRAMDSAGASLAAAFAGLAPVVTLGFEWLLLDTSFSPVQIGGLCLVIAGAVALAYRL